MSRSNKHLDVLPKRRNRILNSILTVEWRGAYFDKRTSRASSLEPGRSSIKALEWLDCHMCKRPLARKYDPLSVGTSPSLLCRNRAQPGTDCALCISIRYWLVDGHPPAQMGRGGGTRVVRFPNSDNRSRRQIRTVDRRARIPRA